MTSIICLKTGTRYNAQYVNNLYHATRRYTDMDFNCVTDDTSGIHEDIICHPLPEGVNLEGWWGKMSLFNPKFYPTLKGEVFYMDLDVVLVRDINTMLKWEREKDLITIRDARLPGMNSSIMKWDRDKLGWVWDEFKTSTEVDNGRGIQYQYRGKFFRGDQDFLNEVVDKEYYPEDWTESYKLRVKENGLGDNTKIVVFHGVPRPHELIEGDPIKLFWH